MINPPLPRQPCLLSTWHVCGLETVDLSPCLLARVGFFELGRVTALCLYTLALLPHPRQALPFTQVLLFSTNPRDLTKGFSLPAGCGCARSRCLSPRAPFCCCPFLSCPTRCCSASLTATTCSGSTDLLSTVLFTLLCQTYCGRSCQLVCFN